MSQGANSVDSTNEMKVLTSNALKDKLEGKSYKVIAEELFKESERQYLVADQKRELGAQYHEAAQALDDLANTIRLKAKLLREGKITSLEAVSHVSEATKNILEFPIPRDATPEILEKIADRLQEKAVAYRQKANDLVKDAEESRDVSRELKEQAEDLMEREFEISEFQMKSIVSRNEGLKIVFDKLSVFKVDSEFRSQVAYSQSKREEKIQRGLI